MQERDYADLLRLHRGLRDIVALPAIPAVWTGNQPPPLVAELADALVGSLQFDFAYARLSRPDGTGAAEVMRGTAWRSVPEWLDARVARSGPLLGQEVVPDIGDDSVRLRGVLVPVGVQGEGGVIAVASRRSDFPNATDQLLLSLLANHAAGAFQSARLVHERTAELERSEWYLAEAQKLTRAGSVALDVPTWKVLHSSAEHSRLYGFDPEREVPSLQDFSERIHPEDRRIPSEALARGVRERTTAEAEYRVVLPNAEERRLLAMAHPVFDASGRIDQFMCTVMDITERRRAESELARLAGEQAALRRVATLVARQTPPEQICAAVAEEVGRMLGVDHTSLSRFEQDGTLTCLACWGGPAAAIAPGTNAPVEDGSIMERLLRTGRPNRVDHDEQAVPGGGARSAIATPIVVHGRLWGAIAATSMHDRLPADTEDRLPEFTELVATAIANVETMAAFVDQQGRREHAEREASRIFELSHDLLCIAGFDGYFKRVNPAFARVLGHSTETMLSRPTREFVHPDDRAARDARHAQRDAGGHVRYEQRQLCSDGSVRRVEWSARFVPEERMIYGVGRDVTESRRAAEEQAALHRVATLVAKSVPPAEILAAVAREVRALFEAASAAVVRCEPDGSTAVVGSAPDASGAAHEDVAAAVAAAGRATRTDGAAGAPIIVEDRLWGVVAVTEGAEPLPPGAEGRLARFTDLVATAIANAESRAEVAAARARAVAAGDDERRRVVRDLHDGAQQRLVHTILTLEFASRAYREGDEAAPELVAEALEHAQRANDDLRDLSNGILPAALTRGGLHAGVETLVSPMPLPVATEVSVGRLPAVVEATAYFVVAEALTNIVKHARATRAAVTLDVEEGTLRVTVRDDGVGGARSDGSGLLGLRDRLEALDARLLIDSPVGGGTLVAADIPLPGEPVGQTAPTSDAATSAEA